MATRNHTPEQRSAKGMIRHERNIKVYRSHYEYRASPNARRYPASRPIPWIQLKGLWLEQAGFDIDTPVRIRVMEGCLVLTAEP